VQLTIPEPALVLLVGPSGSGKSTFAHRHFKPSAVISSDLLRELISDDPSNQDASAEAFRLLAMITNGRLKRRLATVVDATNLRAANRRRFQQLARRYGVPVVVIAFDLPREQYLAHNRTRPGRVVEDDVVADQASRMREAVATLPLEGFAAVYILRSVEAITNAEVLRP
jgi:protein phosphatase